MGFLRVVYTKETNYCTDMKLESLKDIKDLHYEGYVWSSDAKEPKIIDGKIGKLPEDGENPFIIEALLWAANERISVQIRHSDKYVIHENDLSDTNLAEDIRTYLPHKLKGIKKLKFKEIWQEVPDPLCLGMPVLKMQALVFVGFEN